MAFLSKQQLQEIGFRHIGENVSISERAVFYNAANISIGDNTRIDDFCIISAGEGGITIGKFVHIAVYCSLMGSGNITMEDFSGLSSRVSVYSSSDDYSGKFMTNPCVPKEYTNVNSGPVLLQKHVIVGVGACILPNVIIGVGSAIGAFSLVSKNIESHTIAVGAPAVAKVERKQDMFELEKQFLDSVSKS